MVIINRTVSRYILHATWTCRKRRKNSTYDCSIVLHSRFTFRSILGSIYVRMGRKSITERVCRNFSVRGHGNGACTYEKADRRSRRLDFLNHCPCDSILFRIRRAWLKKQKRLMIHTREVIIKRFPVFNVNSNRSVSTVPRANI